MLNSLSNHVSGLSAKAVHTSAHSFGLGVTGFGKRDIASQHPKSLFSDPSTLSTCWGNPNSSFTSSVNNCESPFCLEFEHILVGDRFSIKGINNLKSIVSENKFRFDPDCMCDCDQNSTKQQFEGDSKRIVVYRKTVNGKKTYQQNQSASPSKITSRTKSFIHNPIIAGESQ